MMTTVVKTAKKEYTLDEIETIMEYHGIVFMQDAIKMLDSLAEAKRIALTLPKSTQCKGCTRCTCGKR